MQIHELTALARNSKASDIHISEGLPLMFRIDGHLAEAPVQLSAAETRSLILSLMDEAHREAITSERIDADFALVAPDGTRSRVNVFYQQGRAAATLRLLNDSIPTLEELAMPPVLTKLADEPRGLILVTGPTGSGKSTTLAAMIDHINKTRSDHIITIEDPIEYVYQGRCSLIHQREVGADVRSFASALRSALREDPDVILVGEMRDYETISAAVTAAETGHLVMSTLHTIGAAQTIDRIIDVCPAGAQNQIRGQLAAVLRGVITQQLLPLAVGKGRCAATEILVGTDAVANLIREGKCYQIPSILQSGAALGMHSLNADLAQHHGVAVRVAQQLPDQFHRKIARLTGPASALGHDLSHLAAPYCLMHGPEHAGYLLLQPHFHLGASLLSPISSLLTFTVHNDHPLCFRPVAQAQMLVQHFQRAQLVGHLDRQTALLAGDGKGDLGQLVQHMVRVDLTQRHPSFSRMGIKKPAGGITSSHEFRWYHITTVGCEIQ